MSRRLPRLLLACALGLLAAPATASAAPCTGEAGNVQSLDILVEGQPSHGLYSLPARPPRGLVVFAHGYGHTVESWRRHVARVAQQEGLIAVAMDFRGLVYVPPAKPGDLPGSRGWNARAGAMDLVAAAQHFDARCPGLPGIVMYGVSMGGNMSGLGVALKAKRSDGRPLFDYWFAVEGAHNVTEIYQGARAIARINTYAANAKTDIEAEMGGTFEQKPQVYAERTNVLRASDIAASGIRGALFVHAYADGLVPYNQSQEMARRLRDVGVPVDMYSVGRRGSEERDTAIPGYAGRDTGYAGHGSEKSDTHVVIMTGFDRLNALLTRGEPAPCNRDFYVDDNPQTVSPDPRRAPAGCEPDPLPPAGSGEGAACADTARPAAPTFRVRLQRGRSVRVAGRAADRGCGRIARVLVSLARRERGGRCRLVRSRGGRLGRLQSCRRPGWLRARGTSDWRLSVRRLGRGRYVVRARAVDAAGNRGPLSRREILRVR